MALRHLDQTRKKRTTQNFFTWIIIILVVIYLLFSFGLKILINTTIFISSLFSGKKNEVVTQEEEIYGQLTIDYIPNATNSAQFEVSGSIINFELLTFYLNDQKVEEINIDSRDSFTKIIGDLEEGDNTLFLIAKTKDNKYRKKSDNFTIIYKKDKPLLEINEPQDNATINNSSLLIKGKTDKETYIKVNDIPVVVSANGEFEYSLNLKEGENKIIITATDIADNTEEKALTINYKKDD